MARISPTNDSLAYGDLNASAPGVGAYPPPPLVGSSSGFDIRARGLARPGPVVGVEGLIDCSRPGSSPCLWLNEAHTGSIDPSIGVAPLMMDGSGPPCMDAPVTVGPLLKGFCPPPPP
ncbi:hypothetical protein SUGI_0551030 [Cryptomeria japonica]|nr:hypothetical protein SUGI_0551030 [Cryptomeria japonica]